ncbi:unnamed protein product [Allacma fusca]|uniref:Uncharacterized protein n=1 Tax=Allacma fusca TaxID=39272 RepID=A0A8J2JK93_9HEXA|nr:unnamed protein product [Allacma fusca]
MRRRVARSTTLLFTIATLLPLVGSRSVNSILTFAPDPPSGHSPGPPGPESLSSSSSGSGPEGNINLNISSSAACNLVPLTFGDKDSPGIKLLSYDDKFLMRVSHPVFELSYGIVPTVLYQVTIEVPSGHEFSLEYWVNGLTEERSRLKRRHQRDRREVLELFPLPSNVDQVVFCSKNSLGGLNADSTMKLYTFHWFLTMHPNAPVPWTSTVNNPSFPTTVIFRLRFRSVVEATSSVFEQNLSISVRPTCQLLVNVGERMKLTLKSLWNPQAENVGLNCTVLIRPKFGFGFELRLTNLSIYGIRDICKGRYLSLISPLVKQHSPKMQKVPEFRPDEFPHDILVVDRKFCGKIEDYSLEERTLIFSPKHASVSAPIPSSVSGGSLGILDEESETPVNSNDYNNGLLLTVSLPSSVKLKEGFALELFPLSPCQKVHLTDLSGQLKYSKNYENDECSIIIHVPYGNTIISQLTFENSDYTNVLSLNESTGPEWDFRDSSNVSNSDSSEDDCILNLQNDVESEEEEKNDLLIQATDLVSDKKFTWCFDPSSEKSVYRRAWKSSGNRVKITLNLKYFDRFHLSYQSSKIPEITGNCDSGWVTLDYGCVTLIEKPASWVTAEEECQNRGGHLTTVRDELAEDKIQKIIFESALFHPSRAYWIGANDRESEGNFQWTSGLPFLYTNWFPGLVHKGNEIVNAQPNDDGFSGQDCVELRQRFSSYTTHEKNVDLSNFNAKWSHNLEPMNDKFHWNDRNCEVKNFFLCEKVTHQKLDFSCNQTLRLLPGQMTSLSVTSPAYPSTYPDNINCFTTVETTPGYRLVVQFDEFSLEESPSCKYDSLEMYETSEAGEILSRNSSTAPPLQDQQGAFPLQIDKHKLLQRICGNWNKRLKFLRYTTALTSAQLHFKFESDFSHHFQGFKARVSAEIEKDEQCVDQHMQKFGPNCYLFVSYPSVNWFTANQTCVSLKGNLVSILSLEEWHFLTRNLMSAPHFDRKSIYWLGGFIAQNNQLVWSDGMPFNFSAFHTMDLWTISNWKCLSLYWHEGGGKGDFAWRLSECNQQSGYVCKKHTQVEVKHGLNRTYTGTGGKLSSPNFPANYYNHLDYTNHLVAPNGTQIVVRFSHLDIETQDDCLYDYVAIIDRRTRNMTRYCGAHHQDILEKLDYVSSSNEVDIVFHTDFADTFSGFEIVWRAVDVSGCVIGKTILTGIGNGFPLHDATIFTPNFPHFNLPGLNCAYTIVAPADQRIWMSFQIFEIGSPPSYTDGISSSENYCAQQDRVVIDLGDDDLGSTEPKKNEIVLCGNLTSAPYRTSFVSYREKMTIRVFSPKGKTGRGFLGKFKAIPMALNENLPVVIGPNASFSLTSLNYPLGPPNAVNYSVSLSAPTNYVITIRIQGKYYPNCHLLPQVSSFLEIRDPYVNSTRYTICQPGETSLTNLFALENNDNDNKIATQNVPGMESAFTLRSNFNRLTITQLYAYGAKSKRWNAQITTAFDEKFRDKVRNADISLLQMNTCSPNPCLNGGVCKSIGGRNVCRCSANFTGPFCANTFCDLNPCIYGECTLRPNEEKQYLCNCHLGYGGDNCERRKKPCEGKPCKYGDCIEVANVTYKCSCHAYWEGVQCDTRMTHIPYKPLSERMLKEPFWLGMITVTVVLAVIGLVWCLKRHFPEKLDKLLNDDLDRNRGISWGSGGGISVREPVPGTSQQSSSPPTSRSFLGRFGIRKPSLLSLSSATSAVSVTASSPHQYENRTFSLDDLLRPTRSMMNFQGTPSPHRRRNYSIQVRRDPSEKQQILQQLVSSGGSQSLDGEVKPATPKPTIAEIIQMSEKRLRLASASSVTSDTLGDKKQSSLEGEAETSFTTATPSMMLTPTSKAEKKVTFARLLDKLAATEMSSSSSCSDVSCAEEKTVVVAPKPPERKKERKGRFRRSKSYNRGRSSETDQDVVEMSSSDTTPDPICPPRFPTRMCVSPTGTTSPLNVTPGGSSNKLQASKSLTKMASADSLLALFRRFSGSNSAPPSPQYSENEESSAVDAHNDLGATPLSTPSSPRNSTLSIRPPAFLITSAEQANTIELPVIDPFSQQPGWRTGQTSSITLEVPMRDYCLSPIHEVPTPLPTPSHSPAHTPMMHRPRQSEPVPMIKVLISSEDESNPNNGRKDEYTHMRRKFSVPVIAISVDGEEEEDPLNPVEDEDVRKLTGETEVIPDVLIHVPPEAALESKPDSMEQQQGTAFIFPPPSRPPRLKREKGKPPPLIFANEILSYNDSGDGCTSGNNSLNQKNEMAVPALSIECATPLGELPSKFQEDMISSPIVCCHVNVKPWDSVGLPLAPPVITINQSSEAESDSDTPIVRKLIRRPNLTFLSPFVGSTDRVPSESNLSTSGYSSMASPCPSRCPSVSPLCPSEAEDNYHCSHHHSQGPYLRRSSLTPATPRKSSLTQRRCSLNSMSPFVCSSRDSTMTFNEKYEDEGKENTQPSNQDIETDSAVEVEAETDLDNQPPTPGICDTISEEMKVDFLQVPRKSMPKSRSLDMNVTSPEQRKHQLKGDSLDSKLNVVDPNAPNFRKFIENACNGGSILEMPEEQSNEKKRLSPVSSRSDSPISELSVVGVGVCSPLTDSDGIYDCPSSEVPNGNKPIQQLQIRRSGRKRERKLSATAIHKKNDGNGISLENHNQDGTYKKEFSPTPDPGLSSTMDKEKAYMTPPTSNHAVSGTSKSPKRRVRASSFNPSTSSSSAESLNSSRSQGSSSSLMVFRRRNNSPTSATITLSSDAFLDSETHSSSKSTPRLFSSSISCDNLPKDLDDGKKSDEFMVPGSAKETTSRKFSRLRTISHQIRFLRRLELSLIRKKESLGVVSGKLERRDSILSSDSSESRCDTSDAQSSQPESFLTLGDTEKPLISLRSASGITGRRRRRKPRVLPLSFSQVSTTSSDHTSRRREYK